MKLDYFDLLSPQPIRLQGIGSIASPRLSSISSVGIHAYHNHLSYLLMEPKAYLSAIGQEAVYEQLTEEDRSRLTIFDLLPLDPNLAAALAQSLGFFFLEHVAYSPEHHCFLIRKNDGITGYITAENYPLVCDVICQQNHITYRPADNPAKAKGKKTLAIMKKLQQGREQKSHTTKADQDMELGNIISAVAGRSHTLNILNIWDLTVFQLWDCFARITGNNVYDIQALSVAAWGDKDHHFDATAWFRKDG